MAKKGNQNKKRTGGRRVVSPTTSTKKSAAIAIEKEEMLFDKQNYILMGLSLALILIGFLLMTGGEMPSPDVWDENIIYSFRRITLAPFVVLVGLVVMIVAIFKK